MDVRDDALQEEISLTTERCHQKYGDLPALVVSVDMGWMKRSSGRS